jgi:hypothetical protein
MLYDRMATVLVEELEVYRDGKAARFIFWFRIDFLLGCEVHIPRSRSALAVMNLQYSGLTSPPYFPIGHTDSLPAPNPTPPHQLLPHKLATHLESKVLQSVRDTGQGLVPATGLDDDADRGSRLAEIDTGDLDTCRVCDRGGVGPGRVDDVAEGSRTGKHGDAVCCCIRWSGFFLKEGRGDGEEARRESVCGRCVYMPRSLIVVF